MATNFSNMSCSQLLAYAKGGVTDSAKVCPGAKASYQTVVDSIGASLGVLGCNNPIAGTFLENYRSGLAIADQACHNAAVTPKTPSTPSTPSTTTQTGVTAPAQARFSPWLLVAGLGALVLLFGKKETRTSIAYGAGRAYGRVRRAASKLRRRR
jgi:hypothetical protein